MGIVSKFAIDQLEGYMAKSNFKTWLAYQKGAQLAGQIFELSCRFPSEEKFSLTDQIRRSSRSVCANLAEGAAKKRYPKHFIAKITDAAGENFETQVWLTFALNAEYISKQRHNELLLVSEEIGKLLNYMEHHHEKFI